MNRLLKNALSISTFVVLGLVAAVLLFNLQFSCVNASPTSNGIVVISSSGYIEGLTSRTGHWILLDTKSGDIWAYSDGAILGKAGPIYIGKLAELGKPILREDKPDKP